MPLLKTAFSDRDPVKVGVVGVLVIALVGFLLFNSVAIFEALTRTTYTAQFLEVGGLASGNPVRVNGAEVGKVTGVELDDKCDCVNVTFRIGNAAKLGDSTRAAVSADTVLGTRSLAISPEGTGELEADGVIPTSRTTSPYDLTEALSTLTSKAEQLNQQDLAKALNTVADTFATTPAPLRSTLDGVSRLSQTIATRDQTLRELLAHASSVTGVLSQRSTDLVTIAGQGRQLLAELNARQDELRDLFSNVTKTVDELRKLVKDNDDHLKPALKKLEDTLDLLEKNDKNIAAIIQGLKGYTGGLGEAIGGGPWFFAYLQNLEQAACALNPGFCGIP
ncbi:MAG TPA: MCE family protein [Pseudonocardia sp.]|jgi:phospholipid/cholesterol/gamma-HCH transport system substrate-binding protein|nr:MCE family protein [Pseudonocardia sp.]